MSASASDKTPDSWFFRLNQWSNTILASFLVGLANLLLGAARLLPRKVRARFDFAARLLKNIALLIAQPRSIRLMMAPNLYLKVTREIVILLGPLTFASVFAALDQASLTPGPVSITISAKLMLMIIGGAAIFSLLFTWLINLLILSGDFSIQKQDELQRTLSKQAAAFTLQVVMLALVLLFLGYLFVREWRDLAAVHLSLLFFVARITYLCKLLQLRWKEMAEVELAAENGSPMDAVRG